MYRTVTTFITLTEYSLYMYSTRFVDLAHILVLHSTAQCRIRGRRLIKVLVLQFSLQHVFNPINGTSICLLIMWSKASVASYSVESVE